jgi:murein DD-endopeptidase MepM/ murein hydrolase activator NlpD
MSCIRIARPSIFTSQPGPVFSWILRALSVRHRYVLTRKNRIRLRYLAIVVTAAIVSFMLGTFVSRPYENSFQVVNQASLSTQLSPGELDNREQSNVSVSPEAEQAEILTKYEQRQNRLNRYIQSAAITGNEVSKATGSVNIRKSKTEVFEFGKGDTLSAVLVRAGLTDAQALSVSNSMSTHFNPRNIKPGQKASLTFTPDAESPEFLFNKMEIEINPLTILTVSLSDKGEYISELVEKEVSKKLYAQQAEILISLYGSAAKAGIPVPVIAEAIRIYSWDVDFQRDIRQGDFIKLMYERLETPEGETVKHGEIVYAELSVNGHKLPLYRFETSDGIVDYFSPAGASVRKTLMKTPIDGARLSSGFGMRRHPVLGYNKMHKGTDFAAPTGTPIYAAGDGVIEKAGRWGAYGNYVRIRHNASLKTAYAHMHNFAKGISVGKRVKQGSVIGYVGTTGRSTGPHLHYEVLEGGVQVNPKKVKIPQGETLKGKQLEAFKRHIREIDEQYALITGGSKYASLEESD